MTLQPTNVILQTNSTPADTYFPKNTLQMMFLQLVPAPMPKTPLPAQHISQTLLLYYNPSKHLSKIEVENVLKGMRQGKGQGLCINRRENNNCYNRRGKQ